MSAAGAAADMIMMALPRTQRGSMLVSQASEHSLRSASLLLLCLLASTLSSVQVRDEELEAKAKNNS